MKYLVMCVGNRDGGDDAVGPFIADKLKKMNLSGIEVIDCGIAPENFTGIVKQKNPEILIIIDAVEMNLKPGELRIVPKEKIGVMHISTHGIPLSVLMKYLSQYIKNVKLIGIQPKTMQGNLTNDIIESANLLIDKIIKNKISTISILNN